MSVDRLTGEMYPDSLDHQHMPYLPLKNKPVRLSYIAKTSGLQTPPTHSAFSTLTACPADVSVLT